MTTEDLQYLDVTTIRNAYSTVCLECAHFNLEAWLENGGQTCAAFDELIPLLIWNGYDDHTEPVDGDQGIQFSPREAVEKGGPGSGNFGHAGRPGKRGGSASGQPAAQRVQVGITSHRPGRTPTGAKQGQAAWSESLEKTTVKNPNVQIGMGGWVGGREPTFVTTWEGNGEGIRAAAMFGQATEQDAVLVMRFTSEGQPNAQPVDQLSFSAALDSKSMRQVEQIMGESKIEGWTWSRDDAGNHRLQMAYIAQWSDHTPETFNLATGRVGSHLAKAGLTHKASRDWADTLILDGENYGEYVNQ